MSPEPQKVRLYGAIHGIDLIFLCFSERRGVAPNPRLYDDLLRLDRGTRIGVEWFSEEDWKELNTDIKQRADNAGIEKAVGYDPHFDDFWKRIIGFLRDASFQVAFLEDKETFMRYNQACVDALKVREDGQNELVSDEGQSAVMYHARLCRHNERNSRASLRADRIHVIERDEALLRAIKEKQVGAAIVGLGHSDAWMANRARIEQERGIAFDSYSTLRGVGRDHYFTTFERDSVPDPRTVFDLTRLQRSLKLMEQGSITDETPDYTGIWDIYFPPKGYFEMFVAERNGEQIAGTIEDCLGSATFTGTENPDGIEFIKEYNPKRCASGAAQKPVRYKAARQGDEFFGHWFYDGMGSPFYLVKKPKANPLMMAVKWVHLFEKAQKQKS